jgi:hypothetical protein
MIHFDQVFYLYNAISLVVGAYLTYGGFRSTPKLDMTAKRGSR